LAPFKSIDFKIFVLFLTFNFLINRFLNNLINFSRMPGSQLTVFGHRPALNGLVLAQREAPPKSASGPLSQNCSRKKLFIAISYMCAKRDLRRVCSWPQTAEKAVLNNHHHSKWGCWRAPTPTSDTSKCSAHLGASIE